MKVHARFNEFINVMNKTNIFQQVVDPVRERSVVLGCDWLRAGHVTECRPLIGQSEAWSGLVIIDRVVFSFNSANDIC